MKNGTSGHSVYVPFDMFRWWMPCQILCREWKPPVGIIHILLSGHIYFFYSAQSCRPCRWSTPGPNKNIPLIYAHSLHSRTDLLFYELGHWEEEHYAFRAMCLLEDCENCTAQAAGFLSSFSSHSRSFAEGFLGLVLLQPELINSSFQLITDNTLKTLTCVYVRRNCPDGKVEVIRS